MYVFVFVYVCVILFFTICACMCVCCLACVCARNGGESEAVSLSCYMFALFERALLLICVLVCLAACVFKLLSISLFASMIYPPGILSMLFPGWAVAILIAVAEVW